MPLDPNALFPKIPSVDELLRAPAIAKLIAVEGLPAVTYSIRAVLEQLRKDIASGKAGGESLAIETIYESVQQGITKAFAPSLRTVINATGVVLHTNLGRAPLSANALAHIQDIASGYSNLEFDLATGERGKRDVHTAHLFDRLLAPFTPYESKTIVVNNCAAAVLLALNSLAEDGEVITSRGELVEIGGSFRIPDIMAKSGAILREVGTTNRTRLSDYENAITEKTKLILRVHRSNFAMVGFTEQPALAELVALGKKRNLPVMEDLGNGAIMDLNEIGVHAEGGVAASLRVGTDVITYSGDKLFGGPQAGMITGRAELIARIRSNPLFRALRVDKLYYAALEATLMDYQRGDLNAIPTLRMIRLSTDQIKQRAEKICAQFASAQNLKAEVIPGESVIGGGTTPNATRSTFLLALTHKTLSAGALLTQLCEYETPIIARVEDNRVLFDLRTVFPEQDANIMQFLLNINHGDAKAREETH